MKSVVDLQIDAPRERVAKLFADPALMPQWMDDLERVEPITGEPGMPGSQFRLVAKEGGMDFVATILARDLPDELRLRLDAPTVAVAISGRLIAASPATTRLISEEVFRFQGLFGRVIGVLARRTIRRTHRRHIEAFQRLAESEAR